MPEPNAQPLRVHKSLLLMALSMQDAEETLRRSCPSWRGTVQEAIDYLRADPREYLDEFTGR